LCVYVYVILCVFDGCSLRDEVANRLVRVVTSIGEVVQYDPSLITDGLSEMMQIIFASDFIGQQLSQIESRRQTPISVDVGFPGEHSHAANGTEAVSQLTNRPSQGVTHRPSGPSQGTTNGLNGPTFLQSYLANSDVFTSSVRARAVLTIGKMCLMLMVISESRRQTPISVDVGFPGEHSHAANGTEAVSQLTNRPSQGVTHRPSGPSQGTTNGLNGPTFLQSYLANSDVFTSSVRARAVLTIGKMCLMDERLAKKCVPVFVKQLVENPDHCIRNNIVAVVCDLCIRYTLLVDRYSAIIALSLRDRSTLVRKQALTLLTCLIKEQYIRWEGQIMYRLVSTLLDEDQEMREYAKVCLLDVLLVQFPKMFEHHFVECLFYFNHVEQGAWAVIKAGRLCFDS
uniref:Cnd1 domain-containing protein n=1 Tax=Ascaris lumbricoides TaxID=6252 RepID=A0A0M3ITZ0_ASCLU